MPVGLEAVAKLGLRTGITDFPLIRTRGVAGALRLGAGEGPVRFGLHDAHLFPVDIQRVVRRASATRDGHFRYRHAKSRGDVHAVGALHPPSCSPQVVVDDAAGLLLWPSRLFRRVDGAGESGPSPPIILRGAAPEALASYEHKIVRR